MASALGWESDEEPIFTFRPDCVIGYFPDDHRFGILAREADEHYIRIDYCPWCGGLLSRFAPRDFGQDEVR
jgi:hypothetical protein